VSNPPRTPAECFATIILWLSRAVDGHSTWGRLERSLALLILDRLRTINQLFGRLAARIKAGSYLPRRSPTPRRHAATTPRQPNPLPQGFAWLVKLVPEAATYGSQLQFLFADPEMAALMATAPGPIGRPIRSLCRMLGVAPPPILAPPSPAIRPRPPKPERPPTPTRPKKPEKPRYVFGLRYPPPFPDPA
jgi:hypothetical protein